MGPPPVRRQIPRCSTSRAGAGRPLRCEQASGEGRDEVPRLAVFVPSASERNLGGDASFHARSDRVRRRDALAPQSVPWRETNQAPAINENPAQTGVFV